MNMKWNPIIDGDLSRIPTGEVVLFTLIDERTNKPYVARGWVVEAEEELEVRGTDPWGLYSNETKNVKAWMELPKPYED